MALNIEADEFSGPGSIKLKRVTPFGLVTESARFYAACQEQYVSTFREDGTVIKAMLASSECDCPSECEGCAGSSTLKWIDDMHFSVTTTTVLLVKQLANDQCETKQSVTEVTYEIRPNGMIRESKRRQLSSK